MNASLFLTFFFAYIIAMTVFGWKVSRRRQGGDEFLLGGRALPLFLTLGTTLATMVGTGSSMGAVGKAYQNGWMGGLYGIGGAIGVFLVAWWFAPVRKCRFMTMSEELSSYTGANRSVMNIVAVFVYLSNAGWLGAHILGGGNYLHFVTGLNPVWAKVFIALGFGVYSVIGGYRAVVWTDTIQAVVLFFGFVLTAILAYRTLGGFAGMQEVHALQMERSGAEMRLMPSLSLVVVIAVGVIGGSSLRQRVYSAQSVTKVRQAFVISGVLYLGFALLPAVIGMAAFQSNGALENRDLAFPWMAVEVLPVAVGIIILLAGLSATMSSASSDAITGVTVVVRELYRLVFRKLPAPEKVVPVSRWALVWTTGLALGMALASKDIIGYISDMVSLFISGMAVTGVLGKFWPRFNAAGAIAVLATASGVALAFKFLPGQTEWWGGSVIPAVVLSTICGVIASLLTPPDKLTHEEAVELLAKEREQMADS